MQYVVTHTFRPPNGERDHVTYWYGPDHGFGTTSGPRRLARVFPHRVAAEDALRSVYGTLAAAKRRGFKAIADRPTTNTD